MNRQAGFTLIDVLATLTIGALVLLMLLQGLRFARDFAGARSREAATLAQLEAADRVIRDVLSRAAPGGNERAAAFVGGRGAIALRSELPLPGTATRRVDARLEVDDQHRLVLRWRPYRHAIPFVADSPVQTSVLADGIDRMDVAYWGRPAARAPLTWYEAWRSTGLPHLVRVRLVFVAGAHRSWPDIVAALMEEPLAD